MAGLDATLAAREAPASFRDHHLDHALREPELRLMLAVLEDAIIRFRDGLASTNPRRLRQHAEVGSWIRSHDTDSPFSFENVCLLLHLDPDYIRSGLEALRRGDTGDAPPIPRWSVRRSGGDDRRPHRARAAGGRTIHCSRPGG